MLAIYRLLGYTQAIHSQYRRSMMLTKIQKWGNSQGIRFPKTLLDELQIHVGDEVNISVEAG